MKCSITREMRDHVLLSFENMNRTHHSIDAAVCAIKLLKSIFKMEDVEVCNGFNCLSAGFCNPGNENSVSINEW